VSVKLDVVAYSDHTVDVENEPALLRLAGVRHNQALADQKAAEIINAAAADSVTPDPTGMAITHLRAVLEQARRKKGERELEVELMAIIADLESRKSDASRSDLQSYATRKNADVEILSSHVLFRRSK
jgi:CRISPR/Cas system CMR-associated protein Cmr5 small subunit